jgi:hypothetical protein
MLNILPGQDYVYVGETSAPFTRTMRQEFFVLQDMDFTENPILQAAFVQAASNPKCILKWQFISQEPELRKEDKRLECKARVVKKYNDEGHLPKRRNKVTLFNHRGNPKYQRTLKPVEEFAPAFKT